LRSIRGVLADGGLLAIPTESSYGLAVDPSNCAAVDTVFRFKGRPADKPLPVVVGDLEQLAELGIATEEPLLRRLAALWPAPLTVVVATTRRLPAAAGGDTLAVRIPAHARLRGLLLSLGHGLTATSANRAGQEPIVRPSEMLKLLSGWTALLIDDGELPGGRPSTVIDLADDGLRVLRPGRYPLDRLRDELADLPWAAGFSAAVAEIPADGSG
jgi:L-threonylcarbamoyladenylate synthase